MGGERGREVLAARVRVPATTSNLGGGFDCVGAAVDRWLEAAVVVGGDESSGAGSSGDGVTIARAGALAGLDTAPADDLLYQGFAALCAAVGRAVPGRLAFTATSEIPVARGLGSSSAALVAGARLANEALGLGCARERVAALCAGIEGHPDNAAPAVFGGAVLGVPLGDGGAEGYAFAPLAVHPDVAMAFAVPDFPIATSAARAILPAGLPHRAAVAAAAKGAALVRGLASGDAALLAYALDDVLHVPFRRALIAGYDEIVRAAASAGAFGATLSGSGSTMVALAPAARAGAVAEAMEARWAALGVRAPAFVQRQPAVV